MGELLWRISTLSSRLTVLVFFMFLIIDLQLDYLYLHTSQNDLDYWSSSTVAKEGNRQTSPLQKKLVVYLVSGYKVL